MPGYGTIVSSAVQPHVAPHVAPKMSRVVVVSVSLAATALVAVACGVALSQATGHAELAVRHYSAKQSSADLDSFFDSLPGTNSHSVLPNARPEHAKHGPKTKTAKHGGKAHRSGHVNKMVEEVAEKEIDADGLPIEVRKKTAQQKQYDLEHEEYEQRLRDYKQQDPDFKEKMDKVHKEWMKIHDNLPKSKAEKREYAKLVAKKVGNVGQIVLNGLGYSAAKPPGDGMTADQYDKMIKENKAKAKIIAEMQQDDDKLQAKNDAQFRKTHKNEVVIPQTGKTHRARAPLLH